MEFIEENARHALKRWVGLKTPKKKPICDHFHLGVGRTFLLASHGIADPLAQWFVQGLSQSCGCCSGGESSGFHHQDAS
jgi:hypothetical protein